MVPLAMVGSPQILQTSEGAKQAPPQNITMEKLSQPLRLIAPKLVSGISLSSAVSSAGVPVSVVMAPSATSPLTLPGN